MKVKSFKINPENDHTVSAELIEAWFEEHPTYDLKSTVNVADVIYIFYTDGE